MLDLEFYMINATSLLLWLFQTCPHEVLLGLIALGALCVVVSVLVLVFKSVVISFYLVRFLLFCLPSWSINLLIGILRCAVWLGRTSGSSSHPLFDSIQSSAPQPSLPNSSASVRAALSREASLLRLPSENHRLSLPQSLALHPNQWSEIEVSRSTQQPVSIADSSRSVSVDSPAIESSNPPRRSNRVRARHFRMRDASFCSN